MGNIVRNMVFQNNNNNDDDLNEDYSNYNYNHRPLRNEEHRILEHPDGPPIPMEMMNHNHDMNHHNVNNHNNNHNPNHNLLQDLDGWLESNGLRSMDDVLPDDDRMTSSYNNHQDECRRIQEEEQYAQSVHQKVFYNDIIKEQKERQHKKTMIQSLHDKTMDIRTSQNEMIYNIPLQNMANVCDTIFTMVQNKSLWLDHGYSNDNDKNQKKNDGDQKSTLSSSLSSTSFLQLSLESYTKSTVQEFVNICLSYHSDDDDYDDEGDGEDKNIVKAGDENTISVNPVVVSKSSSSSSSVSSTMSRVLQQITDDAIRLDCCRIGHYLLATPIVDTIIQDVFIPNIDTNNCFTLYKLADELNLTSSTLLQRTLWHMIHTIGEYSNQNNDGDDTDGDNTDNDMYSQELNERLRIMKRALESSVHGGSGPQRLYFTSMEEYLSIFAERVQYYRERLHEAKESQKQKEQQQEESSVFTIRGRVVSSSYKDAEKKILKQEQRVRTLEIAYAEQKALFRSSNSNTSKRNGQNT